VSKVGRLPGHVFIKRHANGRTGTTRIIVTTETAGAVKSAA
jgi:hypothetical protein